VPKTTLGLAGRSRSTARRTAGICLLLIAVTLALYAQARRFPFVTWDDPKLVAANPRVQQGITTENVAWAFTAPIATMWHPLTMLSHMLDCQLFGLDAGGHRLTSVLLHAANACLLFGLLQSVTGAAWPSALVAGLFALHPLQVESVVWIAERKNVLSTAFALLALWAYAAYAARGGIGRYVLAASLLAMGLMAKPMIVTLPFVFLLLDYWPLGRVAPRRVPAEPVPPTRSLPTESLPTGPLPDQAPADRVATDRVSADQSPASPGLLLAEKIPFLALAAAMSAVTFVVQRDAGSMDPAAEVPLRLRIANALVSYARYIGKTIWPADLAVLYPHPDLPGGTPWAAWQIAGAAGLLLGLTALVVVARRPYALVGWLWYLGTLVPVIGLVQVGEQAMADRYAYLPAIGLFIAAAWAARDAATRWPALRRPLVAAAASVLVAAALATHAQARHWRSAEALYRHALAVAPAAPAMHNNLAIVLELRGERKLAIDHYREALRLEPRYAIAHANLGSALQAEGEADAAIERWREAVRIDPDLAPAHNRLGEALRARGDVAGATRHFQEAVRADPALAAARNNLGVALAAQRRFAEAAGQFREAARLEPENADAHNNLANALQLQGDLEEAVRSYRRALELRPAFAEAHCNLGIALEAQGRRAEAVEHYRRALEIDPQHAQARQRLARTREAAGSLRTE
jgi:tetratricopeptide (TPR) repeat protein